MEGKLHYCIWKVVPEGFEVSVKNRERWRASGETFEEALEKLQEVVGAATGDGEPQFEFPDGPPDRDQSTGSHTEIVAVYGNAICEGPQRQAGLYQGGYCPYCGNAVGRRTSVHRFLTILPRGDGGVLVGGNPVFSERFLSLLTTEELRGLDFIEIDAPKRSRRVFYELVGKSVGSFVAKKGIRPSSSQCPTCGWALISYPNWVRYLSVRDVPDPTPSCFAAGPEYFLTLCMSRPRWRELIGKTGMSGMRTDLLHLLPEPEVDRDVRLPAMQRGLDAPR